MSASTSPRQVLYVEDQPINVMLMEALFTQRPALVLVVATTCAEACALAPRLKPDLLLLDLRLPDGNGHELLPKLRQHAGWHRLGAIAVTAEPNVDPHATAFDEVWHKPLDMPLVLRRLDKWLPPAGGGEVASRAASRRPWRERADAVSGAHQPLSV